MTFILLLICQLGPKFNSKLQEQNEYIIELKLQNVDILIHYFNVVKSTMIIPSTLYRNTFSIGFISTY